MAIAEDFLGFFLSDFVSPYGKASPRWMIELYLPGYWGGVVDPSEPNCRQWQNFQCKSDQSRLTAASLEPVLEERSGLFYHLTTLGLSFKINLPE